MNLFRLSVTDGFSEKTERMVCYFSGFVPSVVVCSLAVKAISMLRMSFLFLWNCFFFLVSILCIKHFLFFWELIMDDCPGPIPSPPNRRLLNRYDSTDGAQQMQWCVCHSGCHRGHMSMCVSCAASHASVSSKMRQTFPVCGGDFSFLLLPPCSFHISVQKVNYRGVWL